MFQNVSTCTVFCTPELVSLIHQWLSPSDLTHCCQVSKEFNLIFTPYLWKSVSFNSSIQQHFFTTSQQVQKALYQNAKYIEQVRIWDFNGIYPFLGSYPQQFTNVHTLELFSRSSSSYHFAGSDLVSQRIRDLIKSTDGSLGPMLRIKNWFNEYHVFPAIYEQLLHQVFSNLNSASITQIEIARAIERSRILLNICQQYHTTVSHCILVFNTSKIDPMDYQSSSLKDPQPDLSCIPDSDLLQSSTFSPSPLPPSPPTTRIPSINLSTTTGVKSPFLRSSSYQNNRQFQHSLYQSQRDRIQPAVQQSLSQLAQKRLPSLNSAPLVPQPQSELSSSSAPTPPTSPPSKPILTQSQITSVLNSLIKTFTEFIDRHLSQMKEEYSKSHLFGEIKESYEQVYYDTLRLYQKIIEQRMIIKRLEKIQLESNAAAWKGFSEYLSSLSKLQEMYSAMMSDPVGTISRPTSTTRQGYSIGHGESLSSLFQILVQLSSVKVFHCSPYSLGELFRVTKMFLKTLKASEIQHLAFEFSPLKGYEDHLRLVLNNLPLQLKTLRLAGKFDDKISSGCRKPNKRLLRSSNDLETTNDFVLMDLQQLVCEGDLVFSSQPFFISRFHKLTSLSLSDISEKYYRAIAYCIRQCCPLLEELAISSLSPEIDCIIDLIKVCSNVKPQPKFSINSSGEVIRTETILIPKNLELCDYLDMDIEDDMDKNKDTDMDMDATAIERVGLKKVLFSFYDAQQQMLPLLEALMDYHSTTLTHLAIKSFTSLWSRISLSENSPMYNILTTFEKLEYMDFSFPSALSNNMYPLVHPNTELYHSNESNVFSTLPFTWPYSNTLKVLRIIMDGLPRYKEATNPTDLNAQLYQIDICRMLGSLHSLEELSLGVDESSGPYYWANDRRGYQKNCLDLSLESGLTELSELKKLRVFKVTRMNHKIGCKELEWMLDHWPALKDIQGLFDDTIVTLELDPDVYFGFIKKKQELTKWVSEKKPSWKIS